MAIIDSELQLIKSQTITETTANGGRMGTTQVISNVVKNLFPYVTKAQRDLGVTRLRKVFAKVVNDNDETLIAPEYWLDTVTPGDDWVVLFGGTQRDTAADLTGAERKYGCGSLVTDVTAGGQTLILDLEDNTLKAGNDVIFVVGDPIRITDKETALSATGNEETLIIDTVTPDGTLPRVTITTTTGLANDYTVAANTRAMSIYQPGDVSCSVDNWVETSSAGTYDESANPITCDNIGTVEETFTLTFDDATNFTVVGDTLGEIGSGATDADFAPSNPDYTKPYFTLAAAGWGGTWAVGETIVFQTHPAAVPLWEKNVVPAGCGSLSFNAITLVMNGESA